jgi:hypothetical protein
VNKNGWIALEGEFVLVVDENAKEQLRVPRERAVPEAKSTEEEK